MKKQWVHSICFDFKISEKSEVGLVFSAHVYRKYSHQPFRTCLVELTGEGLGDFV